VIVHEREHLSNLMITPCVNHIVVNMSVQIGDLIEPM
jgi:hypothetical protein